MAARKVKGEVRQRKVTIYSRPPDLNVILEAEGIQCQGQQEAEGQQEEDQEGPQRLKKRSVTSTGRFLTSQNNAGFISDSQSLTSIYDKRKTAQCTKVTKLPSEQSSQCRLQLTSHGMPDDDVTCQSGDVSEWCEECSPGPGWRRPVSRGQQEDTQGDALGRLKQYAAKLNLPTRRPSYLTWRQEHFDDSDTPLVTVQSPGEQDVTWSAERCRNIDLMLQAIREDLQSLRDQDQTLAHQLMTLRRHIHDVKVSRYYAANRDLLEEAMFNAERDELDDLCDLPPRLFSPALKHYGVTRMNVQTRRFSVF